MQEVLGYSKKKANISIALIIVALFGFLIIKK
jgi:hypothetical protein